MIDSRPNSCKIVEQYNITMYVLNVCLVMAANSNSGKAKKYARASLGISVAGIVVTIVVVIIVASIAGEILSPCRYRYYGRCYRYSDYVDWFEYCPGVRSGYYCYHDHYYYRHYRK